MQNNRDSSVLRSLAMAFGNGLAFGVGVKLTQKRERAGDAAVPDGGPAGEISGPMERLEAMEQRLARVESAPPAIAAPPLFDPKVLEAIVNALDSRLIEQSGQVEQRINQVETKVASELQALQQQDQSVANSVQSHLEEVIGQFNDQLAAIRRRSDEERAALQNAISSLHREFDGLLEQTVERKVKQAVDDRLAVLFAEIAARDTQAAELRTRLEASDERLRSVLGAIAHACQSVSGRSGSTTKAEADSAAIPSAENPLPGFAQAKPAPRTLALPLVSSLAFFFAAGLAALHYLQ